MNIKRKKGNSNIEIAFLLRCLAESNCLERFCRPIPNRSDKAPCCQMRCKGSIIILFYQIFCILFFIYSLQKLFSALASPFFIL